MDWRDFLKKIGNTVVNEGSSKSMEYEEYMLILIPGQIVEKKLSGINT